MGTRTGSKPNASDSFLWRICEALDEPPRMLAKSINVDFSEVEPLLNGKQDQLAEIDRDEVWWKISEYVSTRLGYLMAIRAELNKGLQKDRAKRIARHASFKRYHGAEK